MSESEQTVAPKERINITYRTATGGRAAEKELPLRLLMMGDYTRRQDESPVEDRTPVQINQNNFNDVMKGFGLELSINVENRLSDSEQSGELPVHLKLDSMKAFEPGEVARQMPEVDGLLKIREALVALKGPLGNLPDFKKRLQKLVKDNETRRRLMAELGIPDGQ